MLPSKRSSSNPHPVRNLALDWVRQKFSTVGTSITGPRISDELADGRLREIPYPFSYGAVSEALRILQVEGLLEHTKKGYPYVRVDPSTKMVPPAEPDADPAPSSGLPPDSLDAQLLRLDGKLDMILRLLQPERANV